MSDILVIVMLVFLFYGEPDVWDKLHDRAMAAASVECSK